MERTERQVGQRTSGRMATVSRWGETRMERVNARWPVTGLGIEVYRRWRRLNGPLLAGNLTYRLFLWLLPLILVIVAAMGFETRSGDVVSMAGGSLGLARELATGMGEAAREANSSAVYALTVGIVGLVMASRSLVIGLHYTFEQVWELPITAPRGTPAALAKFISSLPIAVAILAVTLAVRKLGVIGGLSGQGLVFVLGVGVLLATDWVLPRRATHWRELLPGATFGGVVFVVARHTALWYFENRAANASKVYGTLGVVAGVLSMLFVFAVVIVGNALVNAVWHDRAELLAGPDAVVPDGEPTSGGG